jgi:hypothetical protein
LDNFCKYLWTIIITSPVNTWANCMNLPKLQEIDPWGWFLIPCKIKQKVFVANTLFIQFSSAKVEPKSHDKGTEIFLYTSVDHQAHFSGQFTKMLLLWKIDPLLLTVAWCTWDWQFPEDFLEISYFLFLVNRLWHPRLETEEVWEKKWSKRKKGRYNSKILFDIYPRICGFVCKVLARDQS